MAQVTETFAVGSEEVTVALTVDLPTGGETPLIGNVGGLIPAGTTARIVGDINFVSDLVVEGRLTSVDTFNAEGNGFQLLVQHGGQLDLAGKPKSGWIDWGQPVLGWDAGDRVAVAPTKWQKTLLLPLTTWAGDWGGMTRPVDAPDVTLIDGSIQKPEVANLTRSINLRNLRRIHFHDGAGVQSLRYLSVIGAGTQDVLADYPIHFHLNGETSRGSLIEGVVVEGGKNHAFVPHGSHGITHRDCVAYNTIGDVYWWDPPDPNFPPDPAYPDYKDNPNNPNNSNDLIFDHCLVLGTDHPNGDPRITGFFISGGMNNEWRDCVAVGVQGGKNSSGFRWTEHFVAVFDGGNKAHNCRRNGIFTWTNSSSNHTIDGFISYHNRRSAIEHGAYVNPFIYRNVVSHVGTPVASGSDETFAVLEHAMSKGRGLLFENILSDDKLVVSKHSVLADQPTIHRNCTYTAVRYQEGIVAEDKASHVIYEDCGLVPADFTLTGILPDSIIEIVEGGVQTHRWAAGAWS